jgi:hypothetical protein
MCLVDHPSGSSSSSDDEDEFESDYNARINPCWEYYRPLLASHGYELDTVRSVKEFYQDLERKNIPCSTLPGFLRLQHATDDDALWRDSGLVSGTYLPLNFAISHLTSTSQTGYFVACVR